MINLAILVGRVGRDPEIRTTGSGVRVANLRIATSEFVKGDEKTEWHSVVCWDDHLIDVIDRRVQKGTMVFLLGTVRTRTFEQAGQQRSVTEVVLDRFHSRLAILGAGKSAERSGPVKPDWEDDPF